MIDTGIIAGTGHRPKYCPCAYNEEHPWLIQLKSDLKDYLKNNDIHTVISGLCIGWDIWLAEVAIELDIPVWGYVAHTLWFQKWPKKSQERVISVLDKCQKVIYVSRYAQGAYHLRDRKMVDDCHYILALYNPEVTTGGTYYTVNYAKEQKKEIINFWRT